MWKALLFVVHCYTNARVVLSAAACLIESPVLLKVRSSRYGWQPIPDWHVLVHHLHSHRFAHLLNLL